MPKHLAIEDGWTLCRAYDATFGTWLGPAEGEQDARARAEQHKKGQRDQGGMSSLTLIAHADPDGRLALDDHGEPIWPPSGRSGGAVRW